MVQTLIYVDLYGDKHKNKIKNRRIVYEDAHIEKQIETFKPCKEWTSNILFSGA